MNKCCSKRERNDKGACKHYGSWMPVTEEERSAMSLNELLNAVDSLRLHGTTAVGLNAQIAQLEKRVQMQPAGDSQRDTAVKLLLLLRAERAKRTTARLSLEIK